MSLPTYLTGDTATGFANGALLGVAGLALVIGTVLGFALWRSTGNTRKQSDRAHDAYMEVLRLRRILASSPTVAFAAPDTTQRLRAYDGGSAT